MPALLCLAATIVALSAARFAEAESDKERVGYVEDGRAVTPVNQWVTPIGHQLDLSGLRPQALAFSPDGKTLLTAGKTNELIVVDPSSATIRQRVPLPGVPNQDSPEPVSEQVLHPDKEGLLSYTGLLFSPAGDQIFMSDVNGTIKVFRVAADGAVSPANSWSLPNADAPRRKAEIPSGLAFAQGGKSLLVCGNLSNRLLELDATSGKLLRAFDVGVAPYDVVVVGQKAYVSNWGGRRPGQGDLVGPAGRGTTVRVDPERHIASEGSVSVVDLATGRVVKEILTGLHASGLAASAHHPYVVCCNAASDTLSIIDTRDDTVAATISAKRNFAELLGAAPNAAVFGADGESLYVANGSQNAIAVFEFDAKEPRRTELEGLIPVGWYPGAVALDHNGKTLVVANIKGLPKHPKRSGENGKSKGYNSHQYSGSLSFVEIPSSEELPALSERVARNLRSPRIAQALLPPRPDQPPRAIPERIGEPSLIKHVVYIIKENRTFDQVLGAFGRGNGDPSLCVFGRQFTPNHHAIADQFVLLDNTYCCGILSADGHQWSTTAYSTDYMEKSFAGFPRSYPDGMGVDEDDALAYAPSGFIWDNALKHGKTVRNYGEFMGPSVRWRDAEKKGEPDFTACYNAWKKGSDEVVFGCWPSVESLRAVSPADYVGWNMSVPDQFRADFILRELSEFEKKNEYPQLTIICLPQDHTSGTDAGCPTPAACVADNDLAFGRIVEGLSRSKFWPEMAVFAIEDDPQAGWDHVSGYRTIAFCAGPHVKRGEVISTQYNTSSILRTMEQILGLPPMNQFDASAEPMTDCFRDTPDLQPFAAVPSKIALNEMNPEPQAIQDPALRKDALVSATLNFREVDRAPEDVLNRILWRAMRGSAAPYPEWALTYGADDDDDD
ncbi:MAG: bifunctional YncE family protein/alkaline phosphatase family protein [Pirellulales bacterium]